MSRQGYSSRYCSTLVRMDRVWRPRMDLNVQTRRHAHGTGANCSSLRSRRPTQLMASARIRSREVTIGGKAIFYKLNL